MIPPLSQRPDRTVHHIFSDTVKWVYGHQGKYPRPIDRGSKTYEMRISDRVLQKESLDGHPTILGRRVDGTLFFDGSSVIGSRLYTYESTKRSYTGVIKVGDFLPSSLFWVSFRTIPLHHTCS